MITIIKGREPWAWTRYAATPGAVYGPIPELREALLKDQGYICAYCTRRIPLIKKDPKENETSKIEHLSSRTAHPHLTLRYSNMVICCAGNINGSPHCDKSKDGKAIRFSPLDSHVQQSINYDVKDGTIKSVNADWDEDINEVVCLNNALLKQNREQLLSGFIQAMNPSSYKESEVRRRINEYSSKDYLGNKRPNCGIIIWYLEKKLKSLVAQNK